MSSDYEDRQFRLIELAKTCDEGSYIDGWPSFQFSVAEAQECVQRYRITTEEIRCVMYHDPLHHGFTTILGSVCVRGQLPAVQWVVDYCHLTEVSDIIDGFVLSCQYGHLAVAQWLAEHFHLTPDDVRKEALRDSCIEGHMEMVQWLVAHFQLTIDDVRAHECDAFVRTPSLEMMQWLADYFHLTPKDITAQDYLAYRLARSHGQTETIDWLSQVGGVSV